MGIQYENRKAWMHFLTVLLFCAALLILIFGTAYARFESSHSKTLKMTYQAKTDQIHITAVENSEAAALAVQNENTHVMEFMISNGTAEDEYCTYDQIAALAMFATVGVEDPEKLAITLTDGGNTYEAVCTEVLEGSTLYLLYGPGWSYRFFNEAGEEVTWYFAGTQFIERQMFITIEGTSDLPAALSLIASARPGDI